jgi:sarcosine oxidase subunit beta
MNTTADAVVVGAGLNGAATAFFLLAQGLRRIVILDAGLPGSGASGAAVGLLRTHYDNLPETELAAKSMPYFRNWQDTVGADCGWRETGFFRFVEHHEIVKMKKNVAMQRSFGETVEVLSPDAFRSVAPSYRSDDIGAVVHEPHSGTAGNCRATLTLLRRVCADGALLRPFTRAVAIATAHGRVTAVVTERDIISAPVVVLAAGAASRPLAATCGVELPVVAKVIRVATILVPEGLKLAEAFMDPISDSWLVPREQGRGFISAPHPDAGRPVDDGDDDRGFDRSNATAGLALVDRRIPGIAAAPVAGWWGRADCYAPDGKPIIGGSRVAGLFFNTAGAGKGHKTAPAAARALSELAVGGAATFADIAAFSPARFDAAPRPWSDSEYGKRVIG